MSITRQLKMWDWVPDSEPGRCMAVKEDGGTCKVRAVAGTDPPRCARHLQEDEAAAARGAVASPPDPSGVVVDPEEVITSMDEAIEKLGWELGRIGTILAQLEDYGLLGNFSQLYGQHITRYGDMLLKQKALVEEADDPLLELLDGALDRLNDEVEIEL